MDSLRTKGGRAFFMKLLRSDGVGETQQQLEAGERDRDKMLRIWNVIVFTVIFNLM